MTHKLPVISIFKKKKKKCFYSICISILFRINWSIDVYARYTSICSLYCLRVSLSVHTFSFPVFFSLTFLSFFFRWYNRYIDLPAINLWIEPLLMLSIRFKFFVDCCCLGSNHNKTYTCLLTRWICGTPDSMHYHALWTKRQINCILNEYRIDFNVIQSDVRAVLCRAEGSCQSIQQATIPK